MIFCVFHYHLFHDDNEIRKKSRKLFRKYASIELQSFLKNNWKDSLRNSQPHHLFHHEDLDYFACVLASKMVRFHKLSKTMSDKPWLLWELGSLVIHDDLLTEFPTSFADLDFVDNIHFSGNGQMFDMEKSFPYFKNNNLKHIVFRNLTFEKFPVEFFTFDKLESLTLDSYTMGEENTLIEVPVLPKMVYLTDLTISNIDFTKIDNLKNIVGNIRKLNLQNTNLQLHLNIFEVCKHLEVFNCYNQNELINLNLNFENFTEIQEISLGNAPITKIEDTFYKCSKLNRLHITSTNITEIPYSVFCIGSESLSNINIQFSNNKIERIGNKKLSLGNIFNNLLHKRRFFDINLQGNLFSEIPEIFSEINISELNLDKNPIKAIPEYIDSFDIGHWLRLGETKITEIPIAVFKSKARIDISNYQEDLVLPDLNVIPNFYGRKNFHGKDYEKYRKMNELIETKRITN